MGQLQPTMQCQVVEKGESTQRRRLTASSRICPFELYPACFSHHSGQLTSFAGRNLRPLLFEAVGVVAEFRIRKVSRALLYGIQVGELRPCVEDKHLGDRRKSPQGRPASNRTGENPAPVSLASPATVTFPRWTSSERSGRGADQWSVGSSVPPPGNPHEPIS